MFLICLFYWVIANDFVPFNEKEHGFDEQSLQEAEDVFSLIRKEDMNNNQVHNLIAYQYNRYDIVPLS